jgi:hypothetical protein
MRKGRLAELSVGPREFVWREAGTRHVAWTPKGGLMLAIFQVPNKFFEADGPRHRHIRRRLGRHLGSRTVGLVALPAMGAQLKWYCGPLCQSYRAKRDNQRQRQHLVPVIR